MNVFLGLGIPWVFLAIYKSSKGEEYLVSTGTLIPSVIVFCTCAILCIGTLLARRPLGWGELGGPKVPKYITAVWFFLLWIAYVLMSTLFAMGIIKM